MRVIAIGRMRETPEAALFARYAERIRPRLTLVELPDGPPGGPAGSSANGAETKRREAAALLRALPDTAFAVALDLGGVAPDTPRFAAALERWLGGGRPVCFLIGGAAGLDASVLARADHVLSLGPLTWPHLLARAMLAEQLYRARAIAAGHPYHRNGRP